MTMSFNRHIVFHLAVMLLLPLFASCYNYDAEESQVIADSTLVDNTYLEFTVSINNGNVAGTRAPIGGENGDGRETGFERENIVSGITVIFYQDDSGINTASTTTKIDYVKYYPVALVSRESSGGSAAIEAKYTTGEQRFPKDNLDIGKKYHIIVVANANLTGEIEKGNLLSDVRKKTRSKLYDGTGIGVNATNFVMSSEKDYELDFPGTSPAISGVNPVKQVYNFDNIIIERMAARIDFWTEYAGDTKPLYVPKTSAAYDVDGYEYKVFKNATETNPTSADMFKLVAVVPFNVSVGNEFYLKQLSVNANYASRTSEVYKWLDGETKVNWVIDAYSSLAKTAAAHPDFFNSNTLTAVKDYASDNANWINMSSIQTDKYTLSEFDNIIVGYPTENTLDDNSPLYYYATGLAILGYYYPNSDKTKEPVKYVYFGYLRHQEETDGSKSFPAIEKSDLNTTATISSLSGPAMNFGVVRNNIYRISINRILEKGSMELSIKVKKWDPYIHEYIYM